MPVKPPLGGGTRVDVDVHVTPNRNPDADAGQNANPGHNGAEPRARGADPKRRHTVPDDTDLDAILPAPNVSVRSAPLPAQASPVSSGPLENYWIKSAAKLP